MTKIKNFTNKIKNIFRTRKKKTSINNKKIRKKKIQLKLNFHKFNKKKILINLTIYFILIVLIAIHSDIFKIKNIEVIPIDENSNAFIIEKKMQYLKGNLIFKINTKQLKKEILSTEENIKKILISKKYPDTIKIELNSYKTIFETIINKKKYLILENASIIPAKNLKLNYDVLILKNLKLPNFFEYKKVLDASKLKKIKYIVKKLKENILQLKIKKIIYYKKETEIHIIINNDTRLIFDLDKDIEQKLKQLYVLNKEKIEITKKWIIYIDNRIIWKIFYCLEEDRKQCIKNLNFIYDENIK